MKHYFSVIVLFSAVVGSVHGAEAGCAFSLKQSESHESSESMTASEIKELCAQLPFNGESESSDTKKGFCEISTQTERPQIKGLLLNSIHTVEKKNLARSKYLNGKNSKPLDEASPEQLVEVLRDITMESLSDLHRTFHLIFAQHTMHNQEKAFLATQRAEEKSLLTARIHALEQQVNAMNSEHRTSNLRAFIGGFMTSLLFRVTLDPRSQEEQRDL